MSAPWICPDCGAPMKTVERLGIHEALHRAREPKPRPPARSGLFKKIRDWWRGFKP